MVDDRFPLLVQVFAYMHSALVLRFCDIAPHDLLFERNLIRWCINNLGNNHLHPACKVIIARFDWLIQQDLNNRLFGKYTRKKLKEILSTMPER
jgi:hypothetical protein